jgi:ATP-binding cassette subfamily B protein
VAEEVKGQKPEAKSQSGGQDEAKAKKPQLGLKLVFDFWRVRPMWVVWLTLFTIVATAISVAYPYILRLIIDGISTKLSTAVLVRYVVLLVGFGLLRAAGDVLLPFTRGRLNERYQWSVRNAVFRRVLDTGHRFANEYPTGDVMERLDHDLAELSWFACSGLFRTVAAVLSALFALAMMLRMNPFLTLVTVLPAGLAAFGWIRLGPRVYKLFMKWREHIAEINNQLQSAFSGIRLVKAYVMEGRAATRFRTTLDARVDTAVAEARVEMRIRVLYNSIAEFIALLILWVGGILVIGKHLTLGEFVAFNAYMMMLIGPMFDIGNLFVTGRRAQGAVERIDALKHHPLEVEPPDKPAPPERGELRLDNVTFAYGERAVLKDVTMSFPPGRRVGIAGTVGSGKSTIFRLLFRMADPQSGRVTLGNADVRRLDLDAYRALFGYAPQEAMLFSDTVRNNIAFGREAIRDERVREAAAAAELDEDLAGFAKGLDEMLGDRGTRLSGGQKERVAIARALAARPPVVVFDDATSALDAETERDLISHLMTGLEKTAVIIVSHRLSVLAECDYIYVLDAGEVKEQGTHAELLAARGLYWQLYQRQLVKEQLEKL